MSQKLDLDAARVILEAFAKERDWEQFHTPKNLACALSVEASELLELFQWMSDEDQKMISEQVKQKIGEELSDILVYLLRITHVLEIDLVEALEQKIDQNRKKYPAEQVRGKSKKYNEY